MLRNQKSHAHFKSMKIYFCYSRTELPEFICSWFSSQFGDARVILADTLINLSAESQATSAGVLPTWEISHSAGTADAWRLQCFYYSSFMGWINTYMLLFNYSITISREVLLSAFIVWCCLSLLLWLNELFFLL